MSESGPEAAAKRNHAGPSLMPDEHSMSESGSGAVVRYLRFGFRVGMWTDRRSRSCPINTERASGVAD
jgi:hypothetical protein